MEIRGKPIPTLSNFGITKDGTVYRLVDSPTGGHKKGKTYKSAPTTTSPYLYVKLFEHNKQKTCSIHRLLALTYLKCPGNPNDYEVNHKDGNKQNNDLSNLEWCTRSENKLHSFRVLGHTGPREFISSRCKVSNKDVKKMHALRKQGYTCKEIGSMFNISGTHAGRLLSGVRRGWLNVSV